VVDTDGGIAVYVTNGAQAVPAIVQTLHDAGVEIGAVSISRPSLDDVFLEATGRSIEGAGDMDREAVA